MLVIVFYILIPTKSPSVDKIVSIVTSTLSISSKEQTVECDSVDSDTTSLVLLYDFNGIYTVVIWPQPLWQPI